jgi:hypothetical protein
LADLADAPLNPNDSPLVRQAVALISILRLLDYSVGQFGLFHCMLKRQKSIPVGSNQKLCGKVHFEL